VAAQLKLVRRDDFVSDVDSLSLLSYTDGIELAQAGWAPVVATPKDLSVWEAITLRLRGSSHDNLAAKAQGIDQKLKEMGWYKDQAERYGVWLRAQLANETGARQALLLDAKPELKSSLYTPGVLSKNQINEYILALERTPWWEDTSHVTQNLSAINSVGGTAAYTNVDGDVPARLALVSFRGNSGGGGPLYKFWLGIRSTRFGTPANFVPHWSANLGNLGTDSTTAADSSTVSGTRVQCSFATVATMATRVNITCDQVSVSNYNDQRGQFLVLLRAKLSAGSTVVRVRLADGFVSNSAPRTQGRVVITDTAYLYYPLGTIQIPSPGRLFGGTNSMKDYTLTLQAERISGSASLYIDGLTLIPKNEGLVYAENGAVEYVGGDERPLQVFHRPDGGVDSVNYFGSSELNVGVPQVSGGLPPGTGIVVLAGQQQTVSFTNQTINLTLQYYERWATLRGAE